MLRQRFFSFAYISMCAALLLIAFVLPAHAQYIGLRNTEDAVMITMSPVHPSPGQTVTLEAHSSLIDISHSDISWTVNGRALAHGTGIDTTSVIAGALGTESDVRVTVVNADVQATALVTIIPTEVDLLTESDSLVPPFYRGRALPSEGARIRAQAVAQFNQKGTRISPAALIFTWKRNGALMKSASGLGKSSISFTAPAQGGNDLLEVDVATADNQITGYASSRMTSVPPQVVLYEDHPLFGFSYFHALQDPDDISDSEMTFAAVPYFVPADSPNSTHLEYAWSVNGTDVTNDERKKNEITINADNSSGSAIIKLGLTDTRNLLIDLINSWHILFSSTGVSGGGSDLFHAQ